MYNITEYKALLDKCKFYGIKIDKIDEEMFDKLVELNNLTRTITIDGEIYYRLNLTDIENGYVFNSGYKELIGGYGTLQTSILNDGIGNLKCYSMEEYRKRIEQIKDTLAITKGIYVNTDNLKMSKIEINRTFRINEAMPHYERVFHLLMALLPAITKLTVDAKFSNKHDRNIDKNTYYATSKKASKSNCYREIKWYNKTKQLESCYRIVLDEQYIRLEFTICGARKIKKELGTNEFAKLTDQAINDYFNKKVDEWIVRPVKKWKIFQKKKVLQIMKECKQSDGYKWVNKCLTRLLNEEIETRNGHKPLVLDVEEIIPLVNELYPNGDKRKRAKAAFRKIAKEDAWNLTNRDDLKLNEILKKLTVNVPQECNVGHIKVQKNRTIKQVA